VLDGFAGMVPTAALIARLIRLQGLVVGHRDHQTDLVQWLETSGIRPVIDRRFGLQAIADAFRLQARSGHFGNCAGILTASRQWHHVPSCSAKCMSFFEARRSSSASKRAVWDGNRNGDEFASQSAAAS